jgi:protein O-mannosyl-transferase
MNKLAVNISIVLGVCLIVLVVHWPVLSARALSFDDAEYVTDNVLVHNPSWASASRFLTEVFTPSTVGGYYQPLTMISLMLDYAMGGRAEAPLMFHLTSLVIHVVNTVLIIVLLYVLFGSIWLAAAAGLLFGVHPMTVEPIAWISDRKTLLAAFFAFGSLIFYVFFARTSSKKYYAVCFIAYLLSLLSKPTSLFLPLAMLLMDYWPLNRFSRKSINEKYPFYLLLVVFVLITFVSQSATIGGKLPGQEEHGLLNPPLIILHNIIFYPYKMLWPVNLTSHYIYPQPFTIFNLKMLAVVGAAFLLVILLIVSLRWTKAAMVGWLFFFITILPTMQIFKFSDVIASDKFAYMPAVGLLMILVCFLSWFCAGKQAKLLAVLIVVMLLAVAEGIAARSYLKCWKDTFVLYNHMLTLAPQSVSLHGQLAVTYGQAGQHEKAMELLKETIAIDPCDGQAWFNLGVSYSRLQRYPEAIDAFQKTISFSPNYTNAYINLADAYYAIGKFEEMIHLCQKALELSPGSAAAYNDLAAAYYDLGRFGEGIEAYKQAEKITPQDPQVYYGLGLLYLKVGDPNSVLQQCAVLDHLDPNRADLLRSLIKK